MEKLWNKTVRDLYHKFEEHIEDMGFEYIDSGGCREVFWRGNVVIKVPNREAGIIDNIVEAAVWRQYKHKKTPEGILLAPCRLLRNKCLMMVYVEMEENGNKLPKWANKVDCEQVGIYKNRYVAYDYALDVEVPDEIADKYHQVLKANDYIR
jgi:hypothetical protein